jgi:MSHA biogenesis protein MshN
VDLLVEENNFEEATALLREGLKLTPEHSGFSMTLARLQLDTGDTSAAMATLEQGLQAAGDEPQYNAFYAVLLQRAQRHEDAVRHYLVALRSDPMMPTWLVGIGISLQAQGKNADAAEAFGRARDGGQLTPQLGQFVEQRLNQLK